jgi:hypothetical protein
MKLFNISIIAAAIVAVAITILGRPAQVNTTAPRLARVAPIVETGESWLNPASWGLDEAAVMSVAAANAAVTSAQSGLDTQATQITAVAAGTSWAHTTTVMSLGLLAALAAYGVLTKTTAKVEATAKAQEPAQEPAKAQEPAQEPAKARSAKTSAPTAPQAPTTPQAPTAPAMALPTAEQVEQSFAAQAANGHGVGRPTPVNM